LAAVLSHPTIEIYVDSPKWKTEGYWSPNIQNLGDKRSPPTVEEIQKAMTF
jgi:heptosyltransferase-1